MIDCFENLTQERIVFAHHFNRYTYYIKIYKKSIYYFTSFFFKNYTKISNFPYLSVFI